MVRCAGHGEEECTGTAHARVDLDAFDLEAARHYVERDVVQDVAELHQVTSEEMLAAPVSGFWFAPFEGMP